ncbi:MAG: acyltransferase family protein [Nocardioides sp.]
MNSRTRLAWPDVAKGACILLVVVHHVVLKDFELLLPPPLSMVGDFWHDLTYALKPIRMPLFFLVSGFFASSAIRRPLPHAVSRVRGGYYLYVVWLVVMIGVYTIEPDIPANRVQSPVDFVGELLWAASSLWFLYAMVAYFVVARLVRDLNPAVVLTAAALLSVSVSFMSIEENNRAAVLGHLVYYLAGALMPQAVRWLAARRLPLTPLVLGYAAAALVAVYSPLPWTVSAFVASVVGLPLGITIAVRIASNDLGRVLAWIGRRTMRVYVLHLVVLVALVQVPHALGVGHSWSPWVALAYPVTVSAVVVSGCFAVHALLLRLGAGWLFEPPSWVTGHPEANVPIVEKSGTPSG